MEQPKPVPPPSPGPPPPKDERDLRDPQRLGKVLLRIRASAPNGTLSKVYDNNVEHLNVANYDPQPVDHAKTYQDELEARAAEGDKYAASLLAGDSLAEEPVD